MTQEELINKRDGFETDPGVVVSGPYQILHHTSPKFMYGDKVAVEDIDDPDAGNFISIYVVDSEDIEDTSRVIKVFKVGKDFSLDDENNMPEFRDHDNNEQKIEFNIDDPDSGWIFDNEVPDPNNKEELISAITFTGMLGQGVVYSLAFDKTTHEFIYGSVEETA